MYISESTIDDLLNNVYKLLLENSCSIQVSKGKIGFEKIGVLLHLENPLSRLSLSGTKGKIFSPIGELLWYFSGSDKLSFIEYYIPKYFEYSDDNKSIYGAYGPRLKKMHGNINQIDNIIFLLKKRPNSRRAVIQLFDAKDLTMYHKDIPCTNSLQFIIRNNKLTMIASLRSNDAIRGLSHDIFCFTMLQEIVARELDIELGSYYHSVGSLHLYDSDKIKVSKYIDEGYQGTKNKMPAMPSDNPLKNIDILLEIENKIRNKEQLNIDSYCLDPYWTDLSLLLKIFALYKNRDYESMRKLSNKLKFEDYKIYIEEKILGKLS